MLEGAIGWVFALRYVGLYPITVIEGPLITILAGSLAASNQLNFVLAYVIIIAGDLTSDTLYYSIGRFGRDTFIKKKGKYIGLSEERLLKVDRHFLHHAGRTLILGKLAFSVEAPFMVAAGMARYSYSRFIAIMLIGALPKSLALMLIGYFFGFSLTTAKHDLVLAARFVVAALFIIGLIYLVRHITNHRNYILSWAGLGRLVKPRAHTPRVRRPFVKVRRTA
jgi:membrane protein DedA with SNARE-associated domain